jgi:hypothetical protein
VKIKVLEKLNRTMLHVPSYLGGVDAQGKDINSWIQYRPEDVKIAVIAKFVKPQFSFPRDK